MQTQTLTLTFISKKINLFVYKNLRFQWESFLLDGILGLPPFPLPKRIRVFNHRGNEGRCVQVLSIVEYLLRW